MAHLHRLKACDAAMLLNADQSCPSTQTGTGTETDTDTGTGTDTDGHGYPEHVDTYNLNVSQTLTARYFTHLHGRVEQDSAREPAIREVLESREPVLFRLVSALLDTYAAFRVRYLIQSIR